MLKVVGGKHIDPFSGNYMESLEISILLFDGLTALDAIGPYEVLSKIPASKVRFVSQRMGEIECMGGLKLVAGYSVHDVTEANIVIIPGGRGIDRLLDNDDILNWIRMIDKGSQYTASVCTGSLLLGKAGLLKGQKATTHWNHLDKLPAFGVDVVKERYVVSGKFITSAGVSAGIDMSLRLVQLIRNDTLARLIQLAIEYDPMPPFDAGSPEKVPGELLDLYKRAGG